MKATLVAPLPKVNADVEFCLESRADGRVCRYGARWADARPGPAAAARAPHDRLGRTGACDRRRAQARSHYSGTPMTISTGVLKNSSRTVNLVLIRTDTPQGRRRSGG